MPPLPPFKELKSAIDAEDDAAFVKEYGDLTNACNSYHHALNHRGVVIGVPGGTAFRSHLRDITAARQ